MLLDLFPLGKQCGWLWHQLGRQQGRRLQCRLRGIEHAKRLTYKKLVHHKPLWKLGNDIEEVGKHYVVRQAVLALNQLEVPAGRTRQTTQRIYFAQ
jgi:hypothetical protein